MTSDALTIEASEILDVEAARRIDEIRQHVDFICSSLRAKGNMTINQLLQSVRTLTMDEYCNKYNADTSYFLEEQSRKRKGTEIVPPGRKRKLTDAEPHEYASSSQMTSKTKESRTANLLGKASLTSDHTIPSAKSTLTDRQWQQHKHHPQQQQNESQKSQQQHQQQKEFQKTQPPQQSQQLQQQQRQEPQKSDRPQYIQQLSKPRNLQQPTSQYNGGSDESSTMGHQLHRNGDSKCIDDMDEDEEVEFGPLFMQFIRSSRPKITFQLDPQEELEPMEAYQLQIPYEFVDQFGPGHRRRIINQIQHIEDQLEAFKQRLLHPPSRSISPSSPSPSPSL